MDLNLQCDCITTSGRWNGIDVELEGVKTEDVLAHFGTDDICNNFSISDICNYVGVSDILSNFSLGEILGELSRDDVLEYFGIEE